jgi:hypothetical protein
MIEVNEYVRTKNGEIGIFDRYSSRKENSLYKSPFNCFIKIKNRKTPLQYCEDYIVKHSKQLIDLVEVEDILKIKISEEWVEKQDTIKFVVVGQTYTITEIKEYLENGLFKIIQILTKESYMANCYKVGGEE